MATTLMATEFSTEEQDVIIDGFILIFLAGDREILLQIRKFRKDDAGLE